MLTGGAPNGWSNFKNVAGNLKMKTGKGACVCVVGGGRGFCAWAWKK